MHEFTKKSARHSKVEFEVSEDVLVGNSVVISKGAITKGIVTKAKRSGMLGRKGKLEISLKEVTLVSVTIISSGHPSQVHQDRSDRGECPLMCTNIHLETLRVASSFLLMLNPSRLYRRSVVLLQDKASN